SVPRLPCSCAADIVIMSLRTITFARVIQSLLLLHYTCLAQLVRGRPPSFRDEDYPASILLNEGQPLILNCRSDRSERVQWLKDGFPERVLSTVLQIDTTSRNDSGVYRCVASNSVASVLSPPTKVTVQYFDGFESSGLSEQVVYAVVGGHFVIKRPSLIASGESLRDIAYWWYNGDTQVYSNGSYYVTSRGDLVVVDASWSSFGNYKVIASIDGLGEAVSDIFTVIQQESAMESLGRLFIVYFSEDKTVYFSGSSQNPLESFDCVASIKDGTRIRWFLNGAVISGAEAGVELSQNNRRLTLMVPDALDKDRSEHELGCKVDAASGVLFDQKSLKIRIVEEPILKPSQAEKLSPLGSRLAIPCSPRKLSAVPLRIQWYFNGSEFATNDNRLIIDELSQKDFGVYQCEASNEAGSSMNTIWVKEGISRDDESLPPDEEELSLEGIDQKSMSGAPVIISPPKDVSFAVGMESLKLNCVVRGLPATSVTWRFNGVDIATDSTKYDVTSDSLVIHELKKSDSGSYSCIAKNIKGVANATAQVKSTGTNMIEFGPTNQSVVIGTNLMIPCEVSSEYKHSAQLTWFINDEPIPNHGNPSLRLSRAPNGGLLIKQVGPDSIGEYRCTVRANGREESASAYLRIIERPQMPTFVRAELINTTLPVKIRVSWIAGFDGNSPIIKHTIEMRVLGPTQLWSDWEVVVDNVPTEECCSVLIDNLRPSVTAEFRVIASNRYGSGKPSLPSANVTMPQQPPAAAPRNVAASARSANSIIVQWQQPQEELWSGDILGYIVRYRLAGYTLPWIEKNVTTKDARNTAIDQLITWREYEIQVAAYNHRGLGVFSKSIDVTTAEGVPTQAPKNVIANVLNSTAVEVTFTAPDQQRVPGVNLGYKVEFWKGVPLHSDLYRQVLVDPTSTDLKVIVDDLEKFGHYNLTVLCYTSPGDGPRNPPVLVVTDEDMPGPVNGLSIAEVMFNSAVIMWDLPEHPNGIITRFVLRYWNDVSPDEKSIIEFEGSQRNVTLEGLSPSTHYTVDVMASTMKGDGPREETKFESGVPPELPGRPSSLTLSDIRARSVLLSFVPGFDGHTAIRQWIVEAKVADSSVFQVVYNVSAPKARSITVRGLRPYTRYQMRLIAENVIGRGAPSEPSIAFETKQTSPETPASRLFAEPLSSTSLSLSWTPLLANQWNGQPKGYLILYKESAMEHWHEIRIPSLRASDFTLRDLRPYTTYEVQLFAENMFGRSPSSGTSRAKTYEGVPSGVPSNVRADLDSKRAVIVRWDAVEKDQANGNVRGYEVRLVPEQEWLRTDETRAFSVQGATVLSQKVMGLRAFTSYLVFVSACTIVGCGSENRIPAVVLTPEDVPGVPSGVAFSFISENEVRLKWMPPDSPNGKIKGYLVCYWKSTEDRTAAIKAPLSSTLLFFTANGLEPNKQYTFTVQAENTVALGPEAVVQVMTTSVRVPVRSPPVPTRNDTNYRSESIAIRWDERAVDEDEAPVRFVQVEYQKSNNDEWNTLEKMVSGQDDGVVVSRLLPNSKYRFRIRFLGDTSQSVWSAESEWMQTLPAPPFAAPSSLVATPYDATTLLLQWWTPSRESWNADAIGYRIAYCEYPMSADNTTWATTEISPNSSWSKRSQFLLYKLPSFRHYIVRVRAFNSEGSSPFSAPVFVYVGYSIPKRNVTNLMAEPLSSTSLFVKWDPWLENVDAAITGFKVRFVPVTSVLSSSSHDEELMVVENSSCVVTDLRKYTEYLISVTPYNRAGEGAVARIRVRTLEDVPGVVGALSFSDVLLDSVRVSWKPPTEPNGLITGYIVNYKTFKMKEEFKKEVQSRTQQTFYPATNLEEGVTYFFAVWAETSAGRGTEVTSNVTLGPNPNGPPAPTRPTLTPGPSSVALEWKDEKRSGIIGHLIQAKLVSKDIGASQKRNRRSFGRPTHIHGVWVTLRVVEGSREQHEVSYRELEPSSFYVFRVFARNEIGIGKASAETEQLFVPAFIPEDPFYTTWWFIIMVAMSTFVVVVLVVAFLCITGSVAKYKREKRDSVDSSHLANGNFVAFQMEASHRDLGRSRNDLPTRPETKQSWLSDRDPPAYGSILGEQSRLRGAESIEVCGSVVNMYGLETDALPSLQNREAMQRLTTLVGRDVRGSAYVTQREALDMLNKSPKYDSRGERGLQSTRGLRARDDASTLVGYSHTENPVQHEEFADDSFDDEDDCNDSAKEEIEVRTENIASHYGDTDQYRDTWRRVKASDAVRRAGPPLTSSSRAVSTDSGSEPSSSVWQPAQPAPNLSSGFSSFV
uniref:Basement membrane-specific heparan sulfate proteoglycan core protein n=1 Tax=Haemonchus contortus TaxID=6289 RepID=A0A7I4YSC4_HAECO